MKVLLVSTEIWSEKNPEGIVARKLLHGFRSNGCKIDVLTNKLFTDDSVGNIYVADAGSNELGEKIRKRLIGSEKKGFILSCIKMIENIEIDINDYDLLVTRSEPFYLHRIGLYVKSINSHIKWCASFGDPVFCNPYNSSFLKKYLSKKFEENVWSNADIVTHTNQTALDMYRAEGFSRFNNAFVLPNPFDNNFSDNERTICNHERAHVNFVFIGSLYGKRKIDPVLNYLCSYNGEFKLYLIGAVRNVYYENRFGFLNQFLFKRDKKIISKTINNYNLSGKVEILPFMNKDKLDVFLNESADVLINIDANVGKKNIFLSSKIVEYLKYKKPILNFSLPGASVDFMNSVGVSHYIDITKPESNNIINNLFDELIPNVEKAGKYTSKSVTKLLMGSIYDNTRSSDI